jgi:AI-2 transport system ATP-binding protein
LPKPYTACVHRAGRIWLENREISRDSTRARLASGLVYLPEDRQVSGLFLDAPVRWNTVMFNQPSWWQQRKREAAVVERYHRALGIKLADAISPCALSPAATSRRCCWRAVWRPTRCC